jgi:hypothetical protein
MSQIIFSFWVKKHLGWITLDSDKDQGNVDTIFCKKRLELERMMVSKVGLVIAQNG